MDVNIPGRGPHIALDPAEVRYDYLADKNRCPVCGGLGSPWRGWFSCDSGACDAVALVGVFGDWPAGQVFVRATTSPATGAKGGEDGE